MRNINIFVCFTHKKQNLSKYEKEFSIQELSITFLKFIPARRSYNTKIHLFPQNNHEDYKKRFPYFRLKPPTEMLFINEIPQIYYKNILIYEFFI